MASPIQLNASLEEGLQLLAVDEPSTSSSQNRPHERLKFVVRAGTDSLAELETYETKNLTTSQLKRPVLLEQLQIEKQYVAERVTKIGGKITSHI